MIFQRQARRYDCNFYIGNEKINIVQSYTYLGTQISQFNWELHSVTRTLKDDFQSVLRSLRTLMFINIINGSLDGMQIDVIR